MAGGHRAYLELVKAWRIGYPCHTNEFTRPVQGQALAEMQILLGCGSLEKADQLARAAEYWGHTTALLRKRGIGLTARQEERLLTKVWPVVLALVPAHQSPCPDAPVADTRKLAPDASHVTFSRRHYLQLFAARPEAVVELECRLGRWVLGPAAALISMSHAAPPTCERRSAVIPLAEERRATPSR